MFGYFKQNYIIKELLGEGAYGKVHKCQDLNDKKYYAAKFVDLYHRGNDYNMDILDVQQMLYEVEFLRHLEHENIIKTNKILYDNYYICMVGELMDANLRYLNTNSISDAEIKYILYQLLSGTEYLHSLNIIHRDIKPENILMNFDLSLKIGDFGLSCVKDLGRSKYDYVCTRWYRAPELLTDLKVEYDELVDIWSIGCILIELINNGKPIFPGIDAIDTLLKIVSMIGQMPESVRKNLSEDNKKYFSTFNSFKNILTHRFKYQADPLLLDLLSKMVCYKENRISAKNALSHPYFKDIHKVKESDDKKIDDLKKNIYNITKKIKYSTDKEILMHLNQYSTNTNHLQAEFDNMKLMDINSKLDNIDIKTPKVVQNNIIQPKPIKVISPIPILGNLDDIELEPVKVISPIPILGNLDDLDDIGSPELIKNNIHQPIPCLV